MLQRQKGLGFWSVLALTLLMGGSLIAATWYLTRSAPTQSMQALQDDNEFLAGEVQLLRDRIDSLQSRLALLQQETEILRQANRLLREDESTRQSEINRMQSELDFFRGLAGSSGTREGLDVYRAQLQETASPQVYGFTLTLTQNLRRAAIISGRINISVEGTRDNHAETLEWANLGADEPQPTYRFKYFEQISGYLNLPEAFSPTRLLLVLEPDKRGSEIRRGFDWPILFTGSEQTGDSTLVETDTTAEQ